MKHLIYILIGMLILSSCGIKSIPTAKNNVDAKWAEVINQYKRRADLIPSLVTVVKKYAAHERETLTEVIGARAQATKIQLNVDQLTPETMAKFKQAQQGLGGALSKLMAVSERYPDLKADKNFRDLQVQIEGTENRIVTARRRYIESIQQYTNLITVPPTSWFNSMFYHYEKIPQFTVENAEAIAEPPKIDL